MHVGGESPPALRRAVRSGDGWIGMHDTPASVEAPLASLRNAAARHGRTRPLTTTVAAPPGEDVDVAGWLASGVDRVIVTPWARSRDAIPGMRRFAERIPARRAAS